MYADLHLHSVFSDGSDTPDELILQAVKNDIKVIAISDHDTVTGNINITDEDRAKVRIIPAVELSTVLGHSYLHILGYYINVNSNKLSEYIQNTSRDKTENTRINFENAVERGCFNYRWERVIELNKNQPRISGAHVVYAMQKDNYTVSGMSLWEMFGKYFRAESSDFIPTESATAYDAIDIIKKAGGISVIAHPKSIGSDETVADLINYGAEGIEVFHPIHSVIDISKYYQIASDNLLYITGGTDWHGKNNGSNITCFGMCGLENNSYSILKG